MGFITILLGRVGFLAIVSHTAIILPLSALKFKSAGMQTLLGFVSFMEIPACSAVTMLRSISLPVLFHFVKHGVFAQKPHARMKAIKWAPLNV
jgi:hypothetical protein